MLDKTTACRGSYCIIKCPVNQLAVSFEKSHVGFKDFSVDSDS